MLTDTQKTICQIKIAHYKYEILKAKATPNFPKHELDTLEWMLEQWTKAYDKYELLNDGHVGGYH